MNFFYDSVWPQTCAKKMLTGVQLACLAAVSFPFPNACEREENCERVAAVSFPFPNAREQEDNCERVAAPGVLLRSPAFRSLVRSLRRLKKERNGLLRRLFLSGCM